MNWKQRYSNYNKDEYYRILGLFEKNKPTGFKAVKYHTELAKQAEWAWPGSQIASDHRDKAKAIRDAINTNKKKKKEKQEAIDKVQPKLIEE
jgi:hypothetical protein